MTLRTRLVLALTALVAVGLAVFGATTYTLYARSQYQRIDAQLTDTVEDFGPNLFGGTWPPPGGGGGPSGSGMQTVAHVVDGPVAAQQRGTDPTDGQQDPDRDGGQGGRPGESRTGPTPSTTRATAPTTATTATTTQGTRPGPGGPRRPQAVLPPGSYAELRAADGTVLQRAQVADTATQPDLPTANPTSLPAYRTVAAASGDGRWRALFAHPTAASTDVVVLAIPLTGVENQLSRLLAIELTAAVALLASLAGGAWMIVRRGLHPLERMAATAGTITAGDLSTRVTDADQRTEVGQLGQAINSMLDDLEIAFAEREATEQRLRQFLADASHELRTPLTSIQGFAELFRLGVGAATDASPKVDQAVIMRRIEQESARMKDLVEDLLLLARLDQTRPLAPESVDLSVLAADACSDAVAADPQRPVTLDAPSPVVVLGDSDHLRQAIANLVTNALRHTPAGTRIEVGARLREHTAVLRVRDHGPGLDDDALEHVFDRFWQADKARVGTGAGLGLSIVAAIAAEHGGTVSAANAPGGGAAFTLSLPLVPPGD